MLNLTFPDILSLPSVPFEHRQFLPNASGIYFVLADTPNQLVYVGKTQCFQRRWSRHHRIPELELLMRLGLKLDIAWLELRCSDEFISQWERHLIDRFNPPLNDSSTLATEVRRLESQELPLELFQSDDGLPAHLQAILNFARKRAEAVRARDVQRANLRVVEELGLSADSIRLCFESLAQQGFGQIEGEGMYMQFTAN